MVKPSRKTAEQTSQKRAYWQQEIELAKKRFKNFWEYGDATVDAYRLEKADGSQALNKDRYNILYSSTETIRPNLYAQRPTVRVKLRNKDTATVPQRMSAQLIEKSLEYVVEEEDFDEIMENCVEDYLLPGLGQIWCCYEANFEEYGGANDNSYDGDAEGENKEPKLLDEMVKFYYVYWQDFLTGISRGWKGVPWVSRRCWMTREDASKRFGKAKAAQLQYAKREGQGREQDIVSHTAEIWEIWDKRTRKVYWFAESYADDVLDEKDDPLKLKNFFPCPRPLRAISNTRTFVPRAFYSQYKAQAETLNVMTKRIRLLSEALRVVGVYNGAEAKLADILNPQSGNRMVAVDSWAMFAQAGGIKGNIEWLPLDQVIACLIQLQQAREVAKNEIYEITGFSDVIRGVSKASETLGAQNIKADWAGARVRKLQKEVQRFARDAIAIAGELIAEHCDDATIALFAGVQIPPPEVVQQDPNAQQILQVFKTAIASLKNESQRVASIGIETDSTIMADEQAERKDRMDFLGAAGAFLQQAVPAMQTTPQLGPLLAAMLMFTVRTFPSSRPIEDAFEQVEKIMAASPPQPPQGEGGDNGAAAAASAEKTAQIKSQTDLQTAQMDQTTKQAEIQTKAQAEAEKLRIEAEKEQNRHAEAMAQLMISRQELALRERELAVKEAEIAVKQQQAEHSMEMQERSQSVSEAQAEHSMEMQERSQSVSEFQAEHGASMAERGAEQEDTRMENDKQQATKKARLTGKKE